MSTGFSVHGLCTCERECKTDCLSVTELTQKKKNKRDGAARTGMRESRLMRITLFADRETSICNDSTTHALLWQTLQ